VSVPASSPAPSADNDVIAPGDQVYDPLAVALSNKEDATPVPTHTDVSHQHAPRAVHFFRQKICTRGSCCVTTGVTNGILSGVHFSYITEEDVYVKIAEALSRSKD
jgi:hypothetical protein